MWNTGPEAPGSCGRPSRSAATQRVKSVSSMLRRPTQNMLVSNYPFLTCQLNNHLAASISPLLGNFCGLLARITCMVVQHAALHQQQGRLVGVGHAHEAEELQHLQQWQQQRRQRQATPTERPARPWAALSAARHTYLPIPCMTMIDAQPVSVCKRPVHQTTTCLTCRHVCFLCACMQAGRQHRMAQTTCPPHNASQTATAPRCTSPTSS